MGDRLKAAGNYFFSRCKSSCWRPEFWSTGKRNQFYLVFFRGELSYFPHWNEMTPSWASRDLGGKFAPGGKFESAPPVITICKANHQHSFTTAWCFICSVNSQCAEIFSAAVTWSQILNEGWGNHLVGWVEPLQQWELFPPPEHVDPLTSSHHLVLLLLPKSAR